MAADPARRIEHNDPALEALYAAAPEGVRAELVRGMLAMAPAPLPRHQLASVELYAALRGRFRGPRRGGPSGPGGWLFLPEVELELGERPDRFRPDLAGWRLEHARFASDKTPIRAAPEWVCEVLSPSTEEFDRGTKASAYAEHGVAHLWLIDPRERTLEVYRSERGAMRRVSRVEGADVVRAEPFEAAALELAALWDWPAE